MAFASHHFMFRFPEVGIEPSTESLPVLLFSGNENISTLPPSREKSRGEMKKNNEHSEGGLLDRLCSAKRIGIIVECVF